MACTVLKSNNPVDLTKMVFPPSGCVSLLQIIKNYSSETPRTFKTRYTAGSSGVIFKATGGTITVNGITDTQLTLNIGSDYDITFTLDEGREFGYLGWDNAFATKGSYIGDGAYPKLNRGFHSLAAFSLLGFVADSPNFNQDVSNWDVKNITEFSNLFQNDTNYNQPLTFWDTSKADSFSIMFLGCKRFNQPLNHLKTPNLTNLDGMFSDCDDFNQPLDKWDISKVLYLSGTFVRSLSFSQDLRAWNPTSAITTRYMFDSSNFNNYLFTNTPNLIETVRMFYNAKLFNKPVLFDVSKVQNASQMFMLASAFNQDISSLRFSSATSVFAILADAISFNQDLSIFITNLNTNAAMNSMLDRCGLSVANYDKFLNAWWQDVNVTRKTQWENRTTVRLFEALNVKRSSNSKAAYDGLVAAGWTIIDGGI